MSRHDEIKNAYKSLVGKTAFYDGMITCSTLSGKGVCKLVWNMNKKIKAWFSLYTMAYYASLAG